MQYEIVDNAIFFFQLFYWQNHSHCFVAILDLTKPLTFEATYILAEDFFSFLSFRFYITLIFLVSCTFLACQFYDSLNPLISAMKRHFRHNSVRVFSWNFFFQESTRYISFLGRMVLSRLCSGNCVISFKSFACSWPKKAHHQNYLTVGRMYGQ